MDNVHARSSRDDIVTAAEELISSQDTRITRLEGERRSLTWVCSALLLWMLLF